MSRPVMRIWKPLRNSASLQNAGETRFISGTPAQFVEGIAMTTYPIIPCMILVFVTRAVRADIGDPQIRTDHPWYPGELACSTFERLAATQAEQYKRATGIDPQSDQEKALASWFWR